MSGLTAVSRFTGFIRTWAMAVALGVTVASGSSVPVGSSYSLANNIPNMVYELVAGGVLSSMFIPIFIQILQRNSREEAHRFASSVLNVSLIVLGVVALLGTVFAQLFVRTQTFTLHPEEIALATFFFRFFAVQVVFYGVGAIFTGVLNAERRFIAPAVAPIFNNVIVTVTLLGVYLPLSGTHPRAALMALAVGTTLGVLAMTLVQVPSMLRVGWRWRLVMDLSDPAVRRMGRKMVPILGYVALNLVTVSFRNAYALTAFRDGPIALQYAWMFYQLPYGVFAVALATAIFPELSSAFDRGDMRAFKLRFTSGLRVTGLLVLPASAILVGLASPLIGLYAVGRFPASAVPLVAGVLAVWAIGLFSFAAYMFILRTFYSMQDSATPLYVTAVTAILQIGLYAGLTSVTAWGDWRLIGIPASDTISFAVRSVAMLAILRARVGALGGREASWSLTRVTIGSVLGGAAAWGTGALTSGVGSGALTSLAQVLAGGSVGLAVAYGACALLRVPEMTDVRALVARLTSRPAPVPDPVEPLQ
jgi:putative peptidoglycan lipid II flippase